MKKKKNLYLNKQCIAKVSNIYKLKGGTFVETTYTETCDNSCTCDPDTVKTGATKSSETLSFLNLW